MIQVYVYKNGVAYRRSLTASSTTTNFTVSFSFIDIANGTDYYEVFAYAAGTGNKTIDSSGGRTWWDAEQI